MYQTVARLGAGRPIERSQWIAKAAKATGNTPKNIGHMVDVLINPKHRTNNGRVRNRKGLKAGMVQLIPMRAV